MQRMKQFSLAALVALLLVSTSYHSASAQVFGYQKSGTNSVAISASAVYNCTDSLIADGTVVMTDTTSAATSNVLRIGVRPWDGTCLNRHRILGLALGPIRRSSRGGAGTVLITGFHNNARIGATGLAANTPLKTMAGVNGSLTAATDTVALRVGTFLGYNSLATATFPRGGKVLITRSLGVHATALP